MKKYVSVLCHIFLFILVILYRISKSEAKFSVMQSYALLWLIWISDRQLQVQLSLKNFVMSFLL